MFYFLCEINWCIVMQLFTMFWLSETKFSYPPYESHMQSFILIWELDNNILTLFQWNWDVGIKMKLTTLAVWGTQDLNSTMIYDGADSGSGSKIQWPF